MVMVDERKEKNDGREHHMKLLNRKSLFLEGLTAMGSYDDEEIYLETTAGSLCIKGHDLHIKQLNLDEGKMEVEGNVDSFSYSDTSGKSGKGFLNKILR